MQLESAADQLRSKPTSLTKSLTILTGMVLHLVFWGSKRQLIESYRKQQLLSTLSGFFPYFSFTKAFFFEAKPFFLRFL